MLSINNNLSLFSYDQDTNHVIVSKHIGNLSVYSQDLIKFSNDKKVKEIELFEKILSVEGKEYSQIGTGNIAISGIFLENRLSLQLGFPIGTNLVEEEKSLFSSQVEQGLPSQFFIYCDIIDYQLIGNTYAKIIKIVTIDRNKAYGVSESKDFQPIQYVNLGQNNFDEVTIHIKDTEGKFVPFLYGTFIITLHFVQEKE